MLTLLEKPEGGTVVMQDVSGMTTRHGSGSGGVLNGFITNTTAEVGLEVEFRHGCEEWWLR